MPASSSQVAKVRRKSSPIQVHRIDQQMAAEVAPIAARECSSAATTVARRRRVQIVSKLSAAMPHAASRRTTAPCPASSLNRADAVQGEVEEGVVKWCGWHGMQGVRGSNPLSSTPGQRPSTAGIPPDSPPSCSRFAANAERDPVRAAFATSSRLLLPLGRNAKRDRAASSIARVTRASITGVSPIDPPNGLRAEARSRWPPE
jgi:hypothetical protein